MAVAEGVALAERVAAVAEGLELAGSVGVGDVLGAGLGDVLGAGVVAVPNAVGKAVVAVALEAAEDAAVGELGPVPHAVRSAAPTTAMITAAGTRHILMLLPPDR